MLRIMRDIYQFNRLIQGTRNLPYLVLWYLSIWYFLTLINLPILTTLCLLNRPFLPLRWWLKLSHFLYSCCDISIINYSLILIWCFKLRLFTGFSIGFPSAFASFSLKRINFIIFILILFYNFSGLRGA